MMSIQWGNIPFSVVKTNAITVDPILTYDNVDYIYSKIDLDVNVTMNPSLASFASVISGDSFSAPIPSPGTIAATSAAAIRHYLGQPRQNLIVTSTDGAIWIRSPSLDGFGVPLPCDVKNGPFCEVIGPAILHSDRTWEWRLHFTTYIRECTPKAQSGKFVLSNRFTQNMDVDELGFTTITTQGRVVVDVSLGLAATSPLTPDMFRNAYLVPIPKGFTRQVRVTQSSDGANLDYTAIDTQHSHGYLNTLGVQRIEVVFSRGWLQNGYWDQEAGVNISLAIEAGA